MTFSLGSCTDVCLAKLCSDKMTSVFKVVVVATVSARNQNCDLEEMRQAADVK